MGTDHLADGAVLMCINGSEKKMLKIGGHGYITGEREKANCKDCKACVNIPYFGECTKNTETHRCEGFMKLEERWKSTVVSSQKPEKVDGEEVITMDSILVCKRGGVIIPVTSGQGYEEGFDCFAFAQRFQRAILWAMGKGYIDPATGEGCSENGGDPVNLNTGNFVYEKEDLVIPGITKLSFHIYYNSMEKRSGGSMGEGWHHNYGMHIQKEGKENLLYLCTDEGRKIPYRRNIGDIYDAVFGDSGLLKKEGIGFRYGAEDGAEYIFDAEGKMLSRKDRNGNMDTYSYNEKGQLVKVAGANGGVLYYTYNKEGSLIRVEDHTGRKVQLWYQYRKLWKFINCMGHAYTFDYNADGKLESVVTPRGIRGVYNEYDAIGRVIRQEMPDGGVISLAYDDKNMRTYMRERNGSMIIYEKDERCRNIRTVYEDSEEIFGYNDNNKRTLYVDRNGNQTRYGYDSKGNMTRVTDALGRQVRFAYDRDGKLLAVSRGKKDLQRYAYDENRRKATSTDAEGRSTETFYNEKGLPEKIVWPDGSKVTVSYDERGNIAGIQNGYGESISYSYDVLNRVAAVKDGEENITRYSYDGLNHLISVVNKEGNRREFIYNESGRLVKLQDYDGGEMSFAYNCVNKLERMTDKEGGITLFQYDKMGNLIKEIFPSGAAVSFVFDGNDRMKRVEIRKKAGDEKAATVIDYSYDLAGNLRQALAGDGKEILSGFSYGYDALNRLTEAVDPMGGKTLYAYDEAGNISSITDALGNRKNFFYNEARELVQEEDARGNITSYTYSPLGKLESVTDGAGRRTCFEFFQGGRLKKERYPEGQEVYYEYDGLGRVREKRDGNGNWMLCNYDSMGRLLELRGCTGYEKKYTYDAMGNITSMTDVNGNKTSYEYSLEGKLTAVKDALGNRTEYEYDGLGKIIHICQKGTMGEENREIFYERNPLGQIECIRNALGGKEFFSYDALGRVIWKDDREGYRTEYSYMPDGKIKSIVYGDGSRVKMEYTVLGQLSLVKDWLGETKIERDMQGYPLCITDYAGATVRYEWGNMGERQKMVYPDGETVLYRYDKLLRLKEMERIDRKGENFQIVYRYDCEGRLTEKLMPGNLCTQWKYNAFGQLEELVHKDNQRILDFYQYSYDSMGNKVAIEKKRSGGIEGKGIYSFYYDSLSRLKSVKKNGEVLRSYNYDSFGNRIEMKDEEKNKKAIYTYNVLNQMLSEKVWERGYRELDVGNFSLHTVERKYIYTYDKRGNLYSEYQDEEIIHRYTYNAMNRMEKAFNNKGEEVVYFYNGLGQRVKKMYDRNEEKYILDLTRTYNNMLVLKRNKENQRFYWDFQIAAIERRGGIIDYYLNDEFGSPLRVMNGTDNGTVYRYDEFGTVLQNKNTDGYYGLSYNLEEKRQPFGFAGYQYDEECKMLFAQAREYLPEQGRFAAEDVIKGNGLIAGTLNQYVYCLNNPLCLIDPLGLVSEQEAQKVIQDNAQYIYESSEMFGVDPNILAGCIYAEQVRNVDFKDNFDTVLAVEMNFDSSIGVAQVKVSTAKMLQEKGYMPAIEKPSLVEDILGISENAKIAVLLDDNEINIQYAAAYLKYQIDQWSPIYPRINEDIAIQGTLYNLGHEKLMEGLVFKTLGTLYAGFKDIRIPHSAPESNEFGDYVLESYNLMNKLLKGEGCVE